LIQRPIRSLTIDNQKHQEKQGFKNMVFTEDSRVKIPCILHLVRLGYRYLSLKEAVWEEDTNIFPDLFRSSRARIIPDADADDIDRLLADIKLALDNEDWPRSRTSGCKPSASTRSGCLTTTSWLKRQLLSSA